MRAVQALCTWITCDGIEKCRQACGGHGYSLLSGLPTLYASYVQVDLPCLLLPALLPATVGNGIRTICSCAVRGPNIASATLGQTAGTQRMVTAASQNATWEGDNAVLCLQVICGLTIARRTDRPCLPTLDVSSLDLSANRLCFRVHFGLPCRSERSTAQRRYHIGK